MNLLKKVLIKDNIKPYQLNHNHASLHITPLKDKSHTNRNDYTHIDNVIECRPIYHNNNKLNLNTRIQSLIKKSFIEGQLIIPSDILVKSLISIFSQYYTENDFDHSKTQFNHKQQKVYNLLQFLKKLNQDEQNSILSQTFEQQLQICINLTKNYLDHQITKRKQKQLNEYDKIISILRPTKKKPQKKDEKRQNIQKLKNKLLHSLSSGNLHIKLTTEDLSNQKKDGKPSQNRISHKKSEGNLIKFDNERLRNLKIESQVKLSDFFKDPSLKIGKTAVEYDYSAILQGSKSNIQHRNKTFDDRNVEREDSSRMLKSKNNYEITNINKAKKDQAFVFYRPKAPKKQTR